MKAAKFEESHELSSNTTSLTYESYFLSKLSNTSNSKFPHLYNGHNNSFLKLLCGLCITTCVNSLALLPSLSRSPFHLSELSETRKVLRKNTFFRSNKFLNKACKTPIQYCLTQQHYKIFIPS